MAKRYGEGSESNDLVKKQLSEQQQLKDSRIKKIKIGIGVFLVVLSIISLTVNSFKANKIRKECDELETKIADARASLEGTKKKASETDAVAIKENVYSAQDAGSKICDLQNELNTIDFNNEQDLTRMNELLTELRRYVPDGGDNSGNARNIWCYGNKWYFNSNYAMSTDSYPVVFTCYSSDDINKEKLLSYVIADYNVASDTFYPVKVYNTTWLSVMDNTVLPEDHEGNPNVATDTNASTETPRDSGSNILDIVNETDDENANNTSEATTEVVTEESSSESSEEN